MKRGDRGVDTGVGEKGGGGENQEYDRKRTLTLGNHRQMKVPKPAGAGAAGSGIENQQGQIFTTAPHHHDVIAPPPGVASLEFLHPRHTARQVRSRKLQATSVVLQVTFAAVSACGRLFFMRSRGGRISRRRKSGL